MGETTQTDGPCGHDGRDFTAYSMNDLDGTEARSVETQAATCDRCWTELMSLTRIWTNVSRVSLSDAPNSTPARTGGPAAAAAHRRSCYLPVLAAPGRPGTLSTPANL